MTSYPITSNFTLRASTAFVLEKLGFNPACLRYRVMLFLPPPEMEIIKRPGGRKHTRCNFCNRNVRNAEYHRENDPFHKWVCTKRCVEVTDKEEWKKARRGRPKNSILYKCTECKEYITKSDIKWGHQHYPVYYFSPFYYDANLNVRMRDETCIKKEQSIAYPNDINWRDGCDGKGWYWWNGTKCEEKDFSSLFPWRHPGTGPRVTTRLQFNRVRRWFGIPPVPSGTTSVKECRADGSTNRVTFKEE